MSIDNGRKSSVGVRVFPDIPEQLHSLANALNKIPGIIIMRLDECAEDSFQFCFEVTDDQSYAYGVCVINKVLCDMNDDYMTGLDWELDDPPPQLTFIWYPNSGMAIGEVHGVRGADPDVCAQGLLKTLETYSFHDWATDMLKYIADCQEQSAKWNC